MWAGAKRWIVNLLVAYGCVAGFGLVLVAIGQLWSGHPSWTIGVAYAIALVSGVLAAAILRGYIDGLYVWIADRYDDTLVWLFDRPAVYLGGWALLTLLVMATSRHLDVVLIGFPLVTAIGWFNLWRWRARIAEVRASH